MQMHIVAAIFADRGVRILRSDGLTSATARPSL